MDSLHSQPSPTTPTKSPNLNLSPPTRLLTPFTLQDLKNLNSLKRKHAVYTEADSLQSSYQSCQQLPQASAINRAVAYWVEHSQWPSDFMSDPQGLLKRAAEIAAGQYRHWQDVQNALENAGICASEESIRQHEDDTRLVHHLIHKANPPANPPPLEQLRLLSKHVEERNEAAVQTHVLPHVVPSPIVLRLSGIELPPGLDEEFDALWTQACPFISTRPRPDYMVGLNRHAFPDSDRFSTLTRFATYENSVFVTHNVCLPFLICEIKSGEVGLNVAARQSRHSAAIAVRSIFSLFEAAYGKDSAQVRELDSRILVFSIAHDHNHLTVRSHFASGADAATRKYYSRQIHTCFFPPTTWNDSAYSFVRNIYEDFAPIHIQRISNALDQLAVVQVYSSTGGPSRIRELASGQGTDSETISEAPSKRARTKGRLAETKHTTKQQEEDKIRQAQMLQESQLESQVLQQTVQELQNQVQELIAALQGRGG